VKPFLDGCTSDLAAALRRLAAQNLIEELPRQKGQRSSRWRFLQTGDTPPKPPVGGRSDKQKTLRRFVATRILKMEPDAADAIPKGDCIFAYYLSLKIGEDFDARTTVSGLAKIVTAKALGLSRVNAGLAWERVVQNAIAGKQSTASTPGSDGPQLEEARSSEDGQTNSSPQKDDAAAVSISNFAEQVKRAARTAKDGWFGPRKLFIHRAWEAWKATSGETADLPAFKQRLLQALRAGHLELSRADFPMGLEDADLQTALTEYGDETYHFITLDGGAQI
jgi:hypothetical protein